MSVQWFQHTSALCPYYLILGEKIGKLGNQSPDTRDMKYRSHPFNKAKFETVSCAQKSKSLVSIKCWEWTWVHSLGSSKRCEVDLQWILLAYTHLKLVRTHTKLVTQWGKGCERRETLRIWSRMGEVSIRSLSQIALVFSFHLNWLFLRVQFIFFTHLRLVCAGKDIFFFLSLHFSA